MRLKTDIWVKAYMRGCASQGVSAMLVRHGDDDAGAIFIRINRLDGTSMLYGPAPAGLDGAGQDRLFVAHFPAPAADETVEARLAREFEFDADLWLVEVEDRQGRSFLEGWITSTE
jgi:hypothetical protein